MDHQLLVNTIQATAIAHHAWRGSLDTFSDVIFRACGFEYSQSELEKLRALLRGPQLKIALQARDVLCWVGNDGLLRLIDAQPVSTRAARLRLQHNPGPHNCRLCLLSESPRFGELQPERDHKGHFVANSFLHPNCAIAWGRLKAQVAASEANNHE